jgi:hypothetical protein
MKKIYFKFLLFVLIRALVGALICGLPLPVFGIDWPFALIAIGGGIGFLVGLIDGFKKIWLATKESLLPESDEFKKRSNAATFGMIVGVLIGLVGSLSFIALSEKYALRINETGNTAILFGGLLLLSFLGLLTGGNKKISKVLSIIGKSVVVKKMLKWMEIGSITAVGLYGIIRILDAIGIITVGKDFKELSAPLIGIFGGGLFGIALGLLILAKPFLFKAFKIFYKYLRVFISLLKNKIIYLSRSAKTLLLPYLADYDKRKNALKKTLILLFTILSFIYTIHTSIISKRVNGIFYPMSSLYKSLYESEQKFVLDILERNREPTAEKIHQYLFVLDVSGSVRLNYNIPPYYLESLRYVNKRLPFKGFPINKKPSLLDIYKIKLSHFILQLPSNVYFEIWTVGDEGKRIFPRDNTLTAAASDLLKHEAILELKNLSYNHDANTDFLNLFKKIYRVFSYSGKAHSKKTVGLFLFSDLIHDRRNKLNIQYRDHPSMKKNEVELMYRVKKLADQNIIHQIYAFSGIRSENHLKEGIPIGDILKKYFNNINMIPFFDFNYKIAHTNIKSHKKIRLQYTDVDFIDESIYYIKITKDDNYKFGLSSIFSSIYSSNQSKFEYQILSPDGQEIVGFKGKLPIESSTIESVHLRKGDMIKISYMGRPLSKLELPDLKIVLEKEKIVYTIPVTFTLELPQWTGLSIFYLQLLFGIVLILYISFFFLSVRKKIKNAEDNTDDIIY